MRPIDADALMREFVEFVRESNNSDFANVPTWNDAVSLLGSAPTIKLPYCQLCEEDDEYTPCGICLKEGEDDETD